VTSFDRNVKMTPGQHRRGRDSLKNTCVVSFVMTETPCQLTSDPPSSYSLITHPQQKSKETDGPSSCGWFWKAACKQQIVLSWTTVIQDREGKLSRIV
jgi:hypothetical protein